MSNQLITHWVLPILNGWSMINRAQRILWGIYYSFMSLIIHWLCIDYPLISHFRPKIGAIIYAISLLFSFIDPFKIFQFSNILVSFRGQQARSKKSPSVKRNFNISSTTIILFQVNRVNNGVGVSGSNITDSGLFTVKFKRLFDLVGD